MLRRTAISFMLAFLFDAIVRSAPVPMHLMKTDTRSETDKAATKADIEALRAKLALIAENPLKNKTAIQTAKALILTLNVYGDEATKGQAARIFRALDKKDYKLANEAGEQLLNPSVDPAAIKAMDGKYDLEEVASPFRLSKSGGLNIGSDIRFSLRISEIEPKAAELIGARSAALAIYIQRLPSTPALQNAQTILKWNQLATEMKDAGKELAQEAHKGKMADQEVLLVMLKRLDLACVKCHNDFRE